MNHTVERTCRSCGCTDDHACWPTCWWVETDLCSTCAAVFRDRDPYVDVPLCGIDLFKLTAQGTCPSAASGVSELEPDARVDVLRVLDNDPETNLLAGCYRCSGTAGVEGLIPEPVVAGVKDLPEHLDVSDGEGTVIADRDLPEAQVARLIVLLPEGNAACLLTSAELVEFRLLAPVSEYAIDAEPQGNENARELDPVSCGHGASLGALR